MADKVKEKDLKKELSRQFYEACEGIFTSEKATRAQEFDNKLTIVVKREVTKPLIKLLVENEFSKKVKKVNMVNSHDNKKRAIITFKDESAASDIATNMGVL